MGATFDSPAKSLKVKVCGYSSICKGELRWHLCSAWPRKQSSSAWKSCITWKLENLGHIQWQLLDFRGNQKVVMFIWCNALHVLLSVGDWRYEGGMFGGRVWGYWVFLLDLPLWKVLGITRNQLMLPFPLRCPHLQSTPGHSAYPCTLSPTIMLTLI